MFQVFSNLYYPERLRVKSVKGGSSNAHQQCYDILCEWAKFLEGGHCFSGCVLSFLFLAAHEAIHNAGDHLHEKKIPCSERS